MSTSYHTVLTIAGSDSSGGAGIQADLKSISANGGYGASVITATTAQNTQGVRDIHPIPISHIIQQLQAVLDDITIHTVKIGMLHSSEVIQAIQKTLAEYKMQRIVLDPVMIATSGDKLINDDAIESLKTFIPHTFLITPNIPEAEVLIGQSISRDNLEEMAQALGQKYHTSVLLKGGHLDFTDTMYDALYDHTTKQTHLIENPAILTQNTHGTGCTLSSAIATYLSKGHSLLRAVTDASRYLNHAIDTGKDKILGKGHGPVNHFGL